MTHAPSFIGFHALPVRHGMTLGELAKMFNAELKFDADLVVVPCANWTRDEWLDQTGLPWTNPSPSIRSLTAATLYPGLCLLEGTSVSMGRGTLKPFEQIGAPYIDGDRLARAMNQAGLPGVRFEAVKFTPRAELYPGAPATLKHHDQECGGVRVVLTEREQCAVIDVGIVLALTLQRFYPEQFKVDDMARLLGDDETLQALKAQRSLAEIKAGWARREAEFVTRRKAFLLYGPVR